MVKGGFQGLDITGVDLTAQSPTLPGAYAACAGADGKPIRVQTADGQVECSVKKVSTNYVIAGVTGDGKILSITIGNTDGITVEESESLAGDQTYVLDLSDSATINLTEYSMQLPFTAPTDGYASLKVAKTNNDVGDKVTLCFNAKITSDTFSSHTLYYNANGDSYSKVFIRKGLKIYGIKGGSGTGDKDVKFFPLKEG